MAQQGEGAIANQVGSRLLTTYHRHYGIRDNLFFCQTISIYLSIHQRHDKIIAWVCTVILKQSTEINNHFLQATQCNRSAVRIMLEVTEYLCEVRRPFCQLFPIG